MDCPYVSYAEKPSEDCEDPQYVEAIREAKENIGDLKLKSAKDFTVPKHLRMNAEKKRAQLREVEENVQTTTHAHTSSHSDRFPSNLALTLPITTFYQI